MMRQLVLVILAITLATTVSANQVTILPLSYHYIQLTTSGSLSYQIGTLNNDDGLGIYVAPAHCEVFGKNNCGYYDSLTALADKYGRFTLDTTYYNTDEPQLFLFIVNHNVMMPITVIYEYSNHGPIIAFVMRMFGVIFGSYGLGIALFVLIGGGILATIVYALYVLCRGCWQMVRSDHMTRLVPKEEESVLYSVVGQELEEREELN